MISGSESRVNEYFTHKGIAKLAGVLSSQYDNAIIKELIDNGIDAIETAGKETGVITINIDDEGLFITDTAPDFDMDVINDTLTDYNNYTSNKRNYKIVSRGSQGNALKTIAGICYLKNYVLSIFSGGYCYSYHPAQQMDGDFIVKINRDVVPGVGKAIRIYGIKNKRININFFIFQYRLCNRHISFTFNGDIYPALDTLKTRYEHSIHYYTASDFIGLIQFILRRNPNLTTKQFIKQFDRYRTIINDIPDEMKYLKDLNHSNLIWLYDIFIIKVAKEKPKTLINRYQLDPKHVNIVINNYTHRDYQLVKSDSFFKFDATHGFLYVQGFLFHLDDNADFITEYNGLNRSINYDDYHNAFLLHLEQQEDGVYKDPDHEIKEIKSITKKIGGSFIVYWNCVSPAFTYSNYRKSMIDVSDYTKQIIDLYKSLFDPLEREYKSKINAKKKKNTQSMRGLMRKYFNKAFEQAKGSYQFVMARQVFYVLRELINQHEEVDITEQYNTFTQKILTEFQEKNDKYEAIFMERRGFFYESFFDKEIPLSTKDVRTYALSSHKNRIEEHISSSYDFNPELLYNKVLFIEKQGFVHLLQSSGILTELNMGLICSQGMGTRSVKELIKYFNDRDITVYCLHDCDIAGYRIYHNLSNPTDTYKGTLKVIDIGISIEDVKTYSLQTEFLTSKKSYTNIIEDMSQSEKDFFYHGKTTKNKQELFKYQRCELTAFNNEQFIAFIKDKIKYDPIIPDEVTIRNTIQMNKVELIKDILYSQYLSGINDKLGTIDVELDTQKLIDELEKNHGNGQHWINVIRSSYADQRRDIINKMCKYVNIEIRPSKQGEDT